MQYIRVGVEETTQDLARFRLYAEHVTHLDAFGRNGHYYAIFGWRVLMLHARRQALLPNLTSLNLHSSSDNHGPDQLLWANTFATPSLAEFSVTPSVSFSGPPISCLTASAVLDTITKLSPRIHKLEMFPSEALGGYMNDGENYLLNFLSDKPFWQYLSGAQDLRELSGNQAWLGSLALSVLGRLPMLEKLFIYPSAEEIDIDSNNLTSESFPTLTHLSIYWVAPFDVGSILSLEPMLVRLTALTVITPVTTLEHHENESCWIQDHLFSTLVNTPNLTVLTIDLDPERNHPMLYDIGKLNALDVMSKLPLQTVILRPMVLGNNGSTPGLAAVWSLVTELRMESQVGTPAVLLALSELPNLEHLVLQLALDAKQIPHAITATGSRHRFRTLESSHGGMVKFQPEEMDAIAR